MASAGAASTARNFSVLKSDHNLESCADAKTSLQEKVLVKKKRLLQTAGFILDLSLTMDQTLQLHIPLREKLTRNETHFQISCAKGKQQSSTKSSKTKQEKSICIPRFFRPRVTSTKHGPFTIFRDFECECRADMFACFSPGAEILIKTHIRIPVNMQRTSISFRARNSN